MSTDKSTFTWSQPQLDIFDFVANGTSNGLIEAVAGAGKTTTIVESLKKISPDKSVCFVAFTKHIKAELETRVPKGVEVYTMHSFGVRSIYYWLKATMDNDKIYKIANMLFPTWGVEPDISKGYISRVMNLVDLGRMDLVVDESGMFNIAVKHGIELYGNEPAHAIQVLKIAQADTRHFDFTDMIYLPVHCKLKVKTYDIVFVDECQDLSKAQQALLRMMVKPKTGRFIAVGDPHQCIFGFAGADVDSFNNFANTPNTKKLPLSVSYRCSQNVVKRAQEVVNHIQFAETAAEGIVRHDGKISEIAEGDFVLCRTTRPLASLCMKFIGQHKKAYVKGSDIGKNLINVLQKTKKPTIKGAVSSLYGDLHRIQMRLMLSGLSDAEAMATNSYNNFKEKIDVIEVLTDSKKLTKVEDLIKLISEIFADDKEGICLSTVHKVKGLESKRVFIIEPQILQAPWAKSRTDIIGEVNIEYVAVTRAKNELVFVPESEFTTYRKRD